MIDRGRDEEKRREEMCMFLQQTTQNRTKRNTPSMFLCSANLPIRPLAVVCDVARQGERGLVWKRPCYTHAPPRRFLSPCFSVALAANQEMAQVAQMPLTGRGRLQGGNVGRGFPQFLRSGTCRSHQQAVSRMRAVHLAIYLPLRVCACCVLRVHLSEPVEAQLDRGRRTLDGLSAGRCPSTKTSDPETGLIWLPRPAALPRFIQLTPARHPLPPLHLICLPGDHFLFFRLRYNCNALMRAYAECTTAHRLTGHTPPLSSLPVPSPGLHDLGNKTCYRWSENSTQRTPATSPCSPSIKFVLGFGGTSHLQTSATYPQGCH